MVVPGGSVANPPRLGVCRKQRTEVGRLTAHDASCGTIHLPPGCEALVIPRARYDIKPFEAGNNSGCKANNFDKSSWVYGRTVSIYKDSISHARDNQPLNTSPDYMMWKEMPQTTKTDQEAGAVSSHITDVRVPAQMAVEQHAQILDCLALRNGHATDPHADGGEVVCVLSCTKEDFSYGGVEFKAMDTESC